MSSLLSKKNQKKEHQVSAKKWERNIPCVIIEMIKWKKISRKNDNTRGTAGTPQRAAMTIMIFQTMTKRRELENSNYPVREYSMNAKALCSKFCYFKVFLFKICVSIFVSLIKEEYQIQKGRV